MKNKIEVSRYLSILVCIIPFVISTLYYGQYPEMVAIHYNINGSPDSYVPKVIGAFGIPSIILLGHIFMLSLFKQDKKKKNYAKVMDIIFIWMAPLFSLVIQSIILLKSISKEVHWETGIYVVVGILFVIIGNYLPKSQPNCFAGIKLPWIMEDNKKWGATNCFTGYIWMIVGVAIVISGLFKIEWLLLLSIFLLIVPPIIYSLLISCK